MMRKIYSVFSICVFLLFSFSSIGQNCDYDQSSLLFNLDECHAYYGFPSETEYDEFTAIADTFPGGTILSVVGDHLYRLNGAVNKHSCTLSYDSTAALCIGSLDSCIYVADSDKAIRFDIKVELGTDGIGRLSGLSFHEAAAPTFSWLNNGNSGPNNHPTKYALRVSVDNVTIFEEIDIETTPEYTLETFDFSDIPAFKVTEMTEFNFELLPYCLVGIESTVSAWDIDNIIVTANAVDNANGGELTFNDGTILKEICTGDGNADIMNVDLSNNFGTTSEYLITNADSIIIAYDAVFPIDFEGESNGTCLVWNISYYDTITNNIIGADITEITGCYDLSNPLTIIKNEVNGGTIEGGPFEFCVGDDSVDNINADDITLTGNIGANGTWVVTDEQGNILDLTDDYSDVDFDDSGIETCLIRFLSFEDGLSGDNVGNNITDLEGCFALSNTIEIMKNERPDVMIDHVSTLCGEDNGSASASSSMGQAPFTYVWSNGTTGISINNLAAGEYTVTVTDANGCSNTGSVNIEDSTSPSVFISPTGTTCGEDNGSATASAINGTAPYTYAWTDGMSGESINNLSPGNYQVTVTDINGCTGTSTFSIAASDAPEVSIIGENTSCGENNGSATATATGSQTPYTYIWSTGSTNDNVSDLAAGNYRVTVTDANGCTDWADIDIDPSTSPIATATSTATTCGEDNGTATVEATSGISPYTYAWSNGSSDQNISDLASGTYTVTVMDSEGCTTTASTTVGNSILPEATTNTTATECGEDNGSATVTATNGISPYTYAWSNGSSSSTIDNLSSGEYSVTVTDAAGCTVTSSATIEGSSNPTATTNIESHTSCGENNGSANVVTSDGIAPYTYIWSTGSTNDNVSDLAAGNYRVTVTDANGCTDWADIDIDPSTSPIATATSTATTCGEDNGTATVATTSGISPYTYAWSNGSSDQNISDLASGTYTVTVTDSEGCTTTASTTVGNSTSPEATTNTTATECGEDNGSATVTATNGISPYTYAWSNGSSSSTINDLSSGDYTVTVTDAAGCTVTSTATIEGSSNPTATTNIELHTSCGENNGSANVVTSDGIAPYTYIWSTGSTNDNVSDLAAGNYRVTVTDANGCTDWADIDIDPSTSPIATVTSTTTTCGEDNGTATVETTSGISPYTYAWSNGSSDQNIGDLTSGTYTVTVTDSEGCTTTVSTTVGNSTSPEATTNTTATECGEDSGSATVTATSGISPYTYAWSNGSSSSTINDLSSGDYSVTVTDAAGCTVTSSATIEGSSNPTATTNIESHTSCGENNGSANVVTSDGIAPYSYIWSTGSTNDNVSDLAAGNYRVTVTDANGCTDWADIDIDPSTSPIATATSTATTCGENNGTATVEATSGISPYTYAWSNGSSDQNIGELTPGIYTVTVTDSEGCTTTASTTVGNSTSPEATTNTTATECGEDSGSATVTATNGISPYTYAWSNGSSSSTIDNLSSGDYSVTVTDAAGCTVTSSATIEGSSNPTATTNIESHTSCGENNGSANVVASDGIAPYTYAWSNGSTSTSISGLASGTYTVTITDAKGCTFTTTATINESTSPKATATSTATTCGKDNGTATVETTSGISPYSYAWSNGSSDQNIFELASGTYTVTVTDSEGCTTTASTTVGNSTSPEATTNTTATECGEDNGSATVTATNGISPYTYAWSNGSSSSTIDNLSSGDYTVTVTDAAGCTVTSSATIDGSSNPTATTNIESHTSCGENNGSANVVASDGIAPYTYAWSNGSTSTSISGLASGTYTVTVTDAKGCTFTTTATINESTSPKATATSTATTCGKDNGTATVETTSGISPYSYAWSNGSSDQNIFELASGTYTVTVTDSEGCTTTSSTTVGNSTSPEATTNTTATECGEDNGSAIVTATNGISPYTYAWSNGSSSSTIDNLSSGDYTVTVTDAAGCTVTSSATIEGSSNPTATTNIESHTSCGENNGSANVVASDGIAPYTYAWSNGSTSTSISGLAAGTYTVTITDAEGCTFTTTATIDESTSPIATATSTATTCGEDNGTATVETTSGISPYSYAWSNGSSDQNIADLASGIYTVTVTDSEGCTDQATINIEESLAAIIEVSANATTCGENNGTAIANPIEGIAPYTYSWSTGAITQMIEGLEPGNYSVTMTDAMGCTDEASVQVEGSNNSSFMIESTPEECGLMNGTVTISINNSGVFTVLWSNGSTEVTQTGLDGGIYSVTVTDVNGCSSEASIDLVDSEVPDGGEISIDGETSIDFCLEGTMDMLSELSLINEIGINMSWIITNEDGTILHLLDDDGIAEFDFDDQSIGTCLIYHVSYEEAMNIMVGNNISEISGCYDLSNEITVTKYGILMSSESSLIIDMNMCAANNFADEQLEYIEFIANIDNDENCATLNVLGGNLYRNNPDINPHSCTAGVNGSAAMCVSSDESCEYNPNSEKAIILDIEVDPAATGNTRLTKLSFFEKSPLTYEWIDGDSGINNYPTKFGVRVLRGSDIVFEESNIPTLQDWNERSFIFTGDDFLVTESTTFTIELLAYCVIGNGEEVTAWDIDDLSIVTECDNLIEAGTLSGSEYEICRDGQPDYITDVTLDGAIGDVIKFVLVADTNNSIVAVFDNLMEFSTFDFESIPIDSYNLYSISAEPGFSGCDVGNIFKTDFEGCYKLSNPLFINVIPCGSIVTAFPNPTNTTITLSNIHTVKGEKTISVYDAMGKLVKSYTVPEDVVSDVIDLSENHPGLYTIRIIGASGRRVARSVIKIN